MRTKLLLLSAVAALGTTVPAASAADGEIALKQQPQLVKVAKSTIQLTFTTDAPLPRRGDGMIQASAKVGKAMVSIGRFVKRKGDPRPATKTSYIAHVTTRGQKLIVGTHVPVVIAIDGQDPIKRKVTLARKFWK